ncbi:creatininase family protein [Georgenia sp. Z1491]|uniref:creatininase family protein n=1 Tax=Georgenia sp. Z1491 TaxID=3416707 RepID=UPI003CF6DA1C
MTAPTPRAARWADLTFPDVAALPENTVAVLPTGAIEQHGPHLPLSTDLVTATEVATHAADAVAADGRADVVLLPALAYTKSDEHAWSPGTIWLSWETLMSTLVDIGRSLAGSGITRVLLVNGHGGNAALEQVALRELRRRFGLATFFVPASVGGEVAREHGNPSELGLGIHGGHTETSMMLHLRPELVHMDRAVRRVPERLDRFEVVGFGRPASFGWLSDDFGPDGHVGDPTTAGADDGRALFRAAVDQAARAITEASTFSVT